MRGWIKPEKIGFLNGKNAGLNQRSPGQFSSATVALFIQSKSSFSYIKAEK